jgi:hypothetical protein
MFQTTNQIKLVNHRFGWLINTSFIFKRKKTEWDQFHIVFLDPKHGFIPKMEDAPKFASHKISIFLPNHDISGIISVDNPLFSQSCLVAFRKKQWLKR